MNSNEIPESEIDTLYDRLQVICQRTGYHLNPDLEFTRGILHGLLVNRKRYGYQSCPCRLASGIAEEDRDIFCPCVYRDADLAEYGSCYCGLYVSPDVAEGKKQLGLVPERRPKKAKTS